MDWIFTTLLTHTQQLEKLNGQAERHREDLAKVKHRLSKVERKWPAIPWKDLLPYGLGVLVLLLTALGKMDQQTAGKILGGLGH